MTVPTQSDGKGFAVAGVRLRYRWDRSSIKWCATAGSTGFMTFTNLMRCVSLSLALCAAPLATSAQANATASNTPVDVDSPDTVVDTAEAASAIAAQDAAVANVAAANPELARRLNGQPAQAAGDNQFRSLFSAWQQMDGPRAAAISIPSLRPTDNMALTSRFGTRSDPFTGRRARHNGIDVPNPTGTPIYATADGTVGRAQWVGGYGNYVEINHGNEMQTRYGHMSARAVEPGTTVRRGQIIGYVGSTGRSTGPHLHYEVRIAGVPVNPLPFIADDGVMVAVANQGTVAMGGPR